MTSAPSHCLRSLISGGDAEGFGQQYGPSSDLMAEAQAALRRSILLCPTYGHEHLGPLAAKALDHSREGREVLLLVDGDHDA